MKKKTIKKPSYGDGEKCIKFRCQTKKGNRLHPDDHDFVVKMFEDFPEWYSETEKNVFDMTKPFGA